MKKFLIVLLSVIGLLILSFCFLFYKILYTGQFDDSKPASAIVVLGAAEYAGKPSPVLQARLDHAFELFKKDFAPVIITTGGVHKGEKFSEGEVGKKYLEQKGIPAGQIIAENNSLTTKQNLMRVFEISKERDFSKFIIVSDPFHMYRATLIAKDLGLDAVSSPTRKSPISKNFWLEMQYMLREVGLSLLHILFNV